MPRIALLAGEGPRAQAFRALCAQLGLDCVVETYASFISAPDALAQKLRGAQVLRVDSPDRDFASLRALYALGAQEAAASGYPTHAALDETRGASGEIISPAQLFFGLKTALSWAHKAAELANLQISHHPEAVALAHDKLATHQKLSQINAPKAELLGPIESFEDLRILMRRRSARRVFLKLRYGSAAAGMIALAVGPHGQMTAVTTGALKEDGRLYASRRLIRLTERTSIAALVDALAPLGLFAERWIAKASTQEGACDLRIVCVGEELFPIARVSAGPMTNLHLGGRRQNANVVRQRMRPEDWAALLSTARRVATHVPGAASIGLDIAVSSDFRQHAVLEINAFGDFVRGLDNGGVSPQEAVLKHLLKKQRRAA